MSNPNPAKPDILTPFDWVLQQSEGIGVDRTIPPTHVYDKLDVPAFLELQAQAMRNNGFRASVTSDGPVATLTWTTVRNRVAGIVDASFTVKAVDGDVRPFRAQFVVPALDEGPAITTGVSSHHLDIKVLGRWFAVFVDQALTHVAIRAEREQFRELNPA